MAIVLMNIQKIFNKIGDLIKMNDTDMIKSVNQLISKRTNYGIREEKTGKNSKMISWSNAQRKWLYYGKANRTQFDANEVVIPDINEKQLKDIIEQLNSLPLDKNSFEAHYPSYFENRK